MLQRGCLIYSALALDSITSLTNYITIVPIRSADVSMDRHTNQGYDHTSGTGGCTIHFMPLCHICMPLM
jgi:hypothetical protein